jgi:hypothetical protein
VGGKEEGRIIGGLEQTKEKYTHSGDTFIDFGINNEK